MHCHHFTQTPTQQRRLPHDRHVAHVCRTRTVTGILMTLMAASMVVSRADASEIYQVVDTQTGQVTFTDRPQNHQSANNHITAIQTLSTPPVPAATSHAAASTITNELVTAPLSTATSAQPAYQLNWLQPSEERAYRRPVQSIEVAVEIYPDLQGDDSVIIRIDGQQMATGTSAQIDTSELAPGPHQLSVAVIDSVTGKTHTSINRTVHIIQSNVAVQQQRQLEAQIAAYQRLPWYQKLYIHMRQDQSPPAAKKP